MQAPHVLITNALGEMKVCSLFSFKIIICRIREKITSRYFVVQIKIILLRINYLLFLFPMKP
jgi:hypothetical protein